MQYVLGMESVEGTVIEKRIEEVMGWDPKKNQSYKPRTKGSSNKNL